MNSPFAPLFTTLGSLALLITSLQADVRLPAIISDHMVLQAEAEDAIWGWADPGEKVTVSISGQSKEATAGTDGKWLVRLDKLAASDHPTVLNVAGKNKLTVNDVIVGEVWLCSGQSNMALRVQGTLGSEQEIAAANNPLIRMFIVRADGSATRQENCTGTWQLTTPQTLGLFSATAYYFGKGLLKGLNVPVGLINSSVGGTRIEAWTSEEAQRATPELKERVAQYDADAAAFNPEKAKAKYATDLAAWKDQSEKDKAAGKTPSRAPMDPIAQHFKQGRGLGILFNGKIAPLIPYTIKGAIWYQGEANSGWDRFEPYIYQLPTLIGDWRHQWGCDFPFAWVQLPKFEGGPGRNWPAMREIELKTLKVPNTGMAIALDTGEVNNIHPLNKPEVGRRLSLWALGDVYGQKLPSTSGPLPAEHKVQGNEVIVSFTHADEGLVVQGGGDLKGFVIAGEDRQWKPATAKIVNDTVVISSPDVKQPVAARYAWANNPEFNLYNGAGLPASPFRTDDWKDTPPPVAAKGKPEAADTEATEGEAAPASAAKSGASTPQQVNPSTTVAEGENLISNGDFSEAINSSKRRGIWMLNITAEKGSSSAYSLASTGFTTAGGVLEADLSQLNPGEVKKANFVLLNQILAPLAPGKHYQLSFEASASERGNQIQVGVGVTVSALGDMDGNLSRQMVDLGTEFKRYAYDFTATPPSDGTPDPTKFTRVDIRMGEAHGKISFKDFRLVEIE